MGFLVKWYGWRRLIWWGRRIGCWIRGLRVGRLMLGFCSCFGIRWIQRCLGREIWMRRSGRRRWWRSVSCIWRWLRRRTRYSRFSTGRRIRRRIIPLLIGLDIRYITRQLVQTTTILLWLLRLRRSRVRRWLGRSFLWIPLLWELIIPLSSTGISRMRIPWIRLLLGRLDLCWRWCTFPWLCLWIGIPVICRRGEWRDGTALGIAWARGRRTCC